MLSVAIAWKLALRHSMIDRESYFVRSFPPAISACDEGPGVCAYLITFCSIVLILVTLPASLCFAVKVVQEYERVVIFRLGRLLSGGARGPGIFFIVPCVDSYQKVDMRTLTFDVPPQEVRKQGSQSQVSQAQFKRVIMPKVGGWGATWISIQLYRRSPQKQICSKSVIDLRVKVNKFWKLGHVLSAIYYHLLSS